ncbi:hypothetical protein GCM10009557_94470 [Virgisporangium ochraceum]|uniref:Uncharacterized protein n=1 Tax=Virgisporangium ochraceum TaxID=65505 RepID=A0A8J4A5U8_9ACTN|nr:hypothetical protein [Virgisporangium ochraceum]GIJ75468.1 hypothetical protein Voc01_103850 [Virgisporangium ochraceum]
MTSDTVSAGGDPRRLLAETRGLAHRVRVAQRVTWLPLLVLSLVMFGAIAVWRLSDPVLSDCRTLPDGQVCKAWYPSMQIYWWTASVLAYVVIAYGYLRVARARGLGTRVLPYVATGIGLIALGAVFAGAWAALGAPGYPDEPSAFVLFVFRLIDPTSAIGLALLLLAWLERYVALAVFAVVYLVVVLVPVTFGWGEHWGDNWQMAPPLAIRGGLLLLGAAGFALAQRWRSR